MVRSSNARSAGESSTSYWRSAASRSASLLGNSGLITAAPWLLSVKVCRSPASATIGRPPLCSTASAALAGIGCFEA